MYSCAMEQGGGIHGEALIAEHGIVVGSLKMNTTLEYSTRVVQEGDRR
jgi:hypothetical protein